jgi:lysophospholipase L1-like esterase
MRERRLRRHVLGRLALLALAAAVLEGGARGYLALRGHELRDHWSGGAAFEIHPPTWVRLRPGGAGPDGKAINEQGLLGDRFDGAPGERRVIALGGSTSFFSDYAGALAARLRTEDPALAASLRVASAGTPGYTTLQTLVNFQTRVLPLRPQVVLVYHGINDLLPLTVRGGDPEDFPGWIALTTSVSGRRFNLRDGLLDRSAFYTLLYNRALALARRARRRDYSERAAFAPGFERHLESLVGLCRAHRVGVVLVTFALRTPEPGRGSTWGPETAVAAGVGRHNAAVRALAERHGLPLVDAAAALDGRPGLFRDLCHFTERGRDRLAELILPALREALRAHPPAPG